MSEFCYSFLIMSYLKFEGWTLCSILFYVNLTLADQYTEFSVFSFSVYWFKSHFTLIKNQSLKSTVSVSLIEPALCSAVSLFPTSVSEVATVTFFCIYLRLTIREKRAIVFIGPLLFKFSVLNNLLGFS